MKFTDEDLMNAMGLQVGDKIKFCDDIFELKKVDGLFMFFNTKNKNECFWIAHLIDQDFEILPRPKRVGELKCEDFECDKCPLHCVCPWDKEQDEKETLYEVIKYLQFVKSDQEIYDLLKARLDKEVEVNEKPTK